MQLQLQPSVLRWAWNPFCRRGFHPRVAGMAIFWAGLAYVVITDRGTVALGCGLAAVPLTAIVIISMVRHHREARMARLGFLGECNPWLKIIVRFLQLRILG